MVQTAAVELSAQTGLDDLAHEHRHRHAESRCVGTRGAHLGGGECPLEVLLAVEVELGHEVDRLLAAERARLGPGMGATSGTCWSK